MLVSRRHLGNLNLSDIQLSEMRQKLLSVPTVYEYMKNAKLRLQNQIKLIETDTR